MSVLFVCTGNTCRSPMAEHLFKKMLFDAGKKNVRVVSAGIAPAHWLKMPDEAKAALEREGVSGVEHEPQDVTRELLANSNLVLVMEEHHRDSIASKFPAAADKIYLLKEYASVPGKNFGISDPFGRPAETYVTTLGEIKDALTRLMKKLWPSPDRRRFHRH